MKVEGDNLENLSNIQGHIRVYQEVSGMNKILINAQQLLKFI